MRIYRTLSVSGLALGAWVIAGCATGERPAPAHDELLQLVDHLSARGPGCAVSIRANGKLVTEYAAGFSSLAQIRPLAPDDYFDIGSVSKSFTAAVAMDLARQSRLSLNEATGTLVRGLPDWSDHVTIADLLYMRSGVPDFIEPGSEGQGWQGDRLLGTDTTLDQPASLEDILAVISGMDELHPAPGTTYAYSNSNYILLRAIIESTAGQPLGDLVKALARERAGIDVRISGFSQGRRLAESPVQGHDLVGSQTLQPFLGDWDVLGASSVWVTVHDLARWGESIMQDPDWFSTMSAPGISQTEDAADAQAGYAAGLMTRTLDGEPFVYHLGGTEGFSSGVFLRPRTREVLAFSCNMSPELTGYIGMTGEAARLFASYEHLVFLYAWLGHAGDTSVKKAD